MKVKSREELEALYGEPYYCIGDGGKGGIFYTAKELAQAEIERRESWHRGILWSLELESKQSTKWLDEFYDLDKYQQELGFQTYYAKKMCMFFKTLSIEEI